MSLDHHFAEPTAIRTNLGAIFVSLELSRSTWLITSLSPGGGEKMSKHGLSAGNIAALLARLSELKQKAFARTGQSFQVIVIQEAGLDGFWIHRVLQSEGVESHVVDAASIAISRRRRRPILPPGRQSIGSCSTRSPTSNMPRTRMARTRRSCL